MPVFISYSHVDKDIVDKIAKALVKERINIWVDRWELNIGDSIVQKVQAALGDSDALLVILSKASVESEWCKKELNVGLIREIEEKKTVLLPVLIEKCERPLFLKDKYYADLSTDFDEGIRKIVESVARVISTEKGRNSIMNSLIDWGISVEIQPDAYLLSITFVQHSPPADGYSIVGSISVRIEGKDKEKYEAYCTENLEWMARRFHLELLAGATQEMKYSILLKDSTPVVSVVEIKDKSSEKRLVFTIKLQWLGTETGRDVVVHLDGILDGIAKSNAKRNRKLSKEETEAVYKIMKRYV